MNYDSKKTFAIPAQFTALNGSVQYYTITFGADVVIEGDDEVAQGNLLRALEVLRSCGAQPVIVKVAGKDLKFVLEQPNCFGHNEPHQISRKPANDAETRIKELFEGVHTVDSTEEAEKLFSVETVVIEPAFC